LNASALTSHPEHLAFKSQQATNATPKNNKSHGAHRSTGGFHENESVFMSSCVQIPARPEVAVPASAFSRAKILSIFPAHNSR
jgi:hypothetical protein